MKYSLISTVLFALGFMLACSKDSSPVIDSPAASGQAPASTGFGFSGQSHARYAGSNYSQSIPVDTANSMIQSYLNSVRYPMTDTALRALVFDADTLRAYLQNPSIVTVKFILAHQPAYKNSGGKGHYSGMKPEALTMIVVGLNAADQYVLNNRNGVYEHMAPCPNHCPGNSSPYIY